jgi:hypothetical protein
MADDPDVHPEVRAADLRERRAGHEGGDAEFLVELAPQRHVGRLAVLDVSPWKVPTVGVPAPSRRPVKQQTPAATAQQPSNDQVQILIEIQRATVIHHSAHATGA